MVHQYGRRVVILVCLYGTGCTSDFSALRPSYHLTIITMFYPNKVMKACINIGIDINKSLQRLQNLLENASFLLTTELKQCIE